MVRGQREREEEVGQAVRPREEDRVHGLLPVEADELPFRPSRDRAREMERRRGGRPTREDEPLQGGMAGVELVDLLLEALDVAGRDLRPGSGSVRGPRELRLGDEQLVAQPPHDLAEVPEAARQQAVREPEPGAQLVVGAVGAEPGRILRYPRTTGETGRSAVTRTGVETRDVLASGRPASSSSGELNPWTGQNEMWSTSLCLAS